MNSPFKDEEFWMTQACSMSQLPRAVLMLLFGTPPGPAELYERDSPTSILSRTDAMPCD